MNTTEKIIQFALQHKFGLSFDSMQKDVEAALGKPERSFDDGCLYLFYDSLEIGLNRNSSLRGDPLRKVSYFKFNVDAHHRHKEFCAPSIDRLTFLIADADMREVMLALVNHSIWFEHVEDYHYKSEDRGIRSLDHNSQFHFRKVKNRWLMLCYFCSEI